MADTQLVMNILAKDRGAAETLGRVARATDRIDSKVSETNGLLSKMSKKFDFAALKGKGMVAVVGGALGVLPVAAIAASGAIVAALGGGLATIGIAAAAQSKKVKNAFTSLKDHVVSTLKEIAAPFEPVLVRIAAMARDTFNSFVPALKGAFAQMAPVVQQFAGDFFKALKRLKPAIQPLTDAFTTLLNTLGPKLPKMFANLAGGITAVANAVSENSGAFVRIVQVMFKIVTVGLKVIAFLTRFPSVAAGVIVALGALAVAFGGPIGAIAGVIAIIGALVSLVIAKFPVIKNAVVAAWNAVKSFTLSVWNSITSSVSGAVTAIKTEVMSRINAVKNFISNAWNRVVSFTSRAWDNILNAAIGAAANLVSFTAGIPGRILRAMGNLGGLLWSAGKDLLMGLWNGIKSIAGWIKDQIMGLVKSIVPGPIEDVLGISSPSKVTAALGREVGRGLAAGMDKSSREVERASGKLASAAKVDPAVADQASMAGLSSARRGGALAGGRSGRSGTSTVRVELEGSEAMKQMIREIVRIDGGGDVQVAFES